jgi:hypothetical protein
MIERRVVRTLNVRSVARVTFAMSVSVWGIAFVGLIALYLVGLVSGGLGGVEGFIASLGFTDFRLTILPFLGVFILVAGIASAVTAVTAGVLAQLYNMLVPVVGGVVVEVEERVPVRRQPAPPPAPAPPEPPMPPPEPPPPAQPPSTEPWPAPTPWPPAPGE